MLKQWKLYDTVPDVLVKDNVFNGKTPLKTSWFASGQQALHSLQLGTRVTDGLILDVSKGLVGTGLSQNRFGTEGVGIPQLYCKYPMGYCISVCGEYDMKFNTFYGQCEFVSTLEEVFQDGN